MSATTETSTAQLAVFCGVQVKVTSNCPSWVNLATAAGSTRQPLAKESRST